MPARRAVLIVNLGSPASTELEDVRAYLEEFLGDELVIDLPRWRWLRRAIVNRVIIPLRLKNSAHAYSKIWHEGGSPLIATSRSVCEKLEATLGAEAAAGGEAAAAKVYLAMRYGQPSIPEVVAKIQAAGVEEVLIFPQYPHYAMSSWETVVRRVCEEFAERAPQVRLHCVAPFYADADYIDALAAVCRPYLDERGDPSAADHLLFSYHGIPARHVGIASLRGVNVQFAAHPHAQWSPEQGGLSYVAHIEQTTARLVERLGAAAPRHSISYQSRMVGEPWLAPYTDHELLRLPREEGVRRLFVLCLAFTTDCLETLEEIQMQGRDSFLGAGGTFFKQIPCLNDHPAYIDFLVGRVRHWLEQP